MREIEVLKTVLIIGETKYGEKCKTNLENLGFSVDLIKASDLISVEGVVGNFEAKTRKDGTVSQIITSAIVIAEDVNKTTIKDEVKFDGTKFILPQSKLSKILDAPGHPRKNLLNAIKNIPNSVCIFLGDASQASKTQTYECLHNALILKNTFDCEIFVLCKDLKISGQGMEELYREARKSGVLFLKYIDKPEFTSEEKIKIKFDDYYLIENGKPPSIEIECELLVLDELLIPDESFKNLCSILEITLDKKNFLQAENINLYPVSSNRKGIFLLGHCHNPDLSEPEIYEEVNIISEQIYQLLSKGKIFFEEKVTVDPEKCAVCLTCIRSCPHKAIGLGMDKDKVHAYIFNQACFECGVCVSICPASAIEFKGYEDKYIFSKLLEAK